MKIIELACFNEYKCQGEACPYYVKDKLHLVRPLPQNDEVDKDCLYWPKISFEYGGINFRCLSVACPEVAQTLLINTTPILYKIGKDDKNISENIDWVLANLYLRSFAISVNILQNRKISITERLKTVAMFNYAVHFAMKDGTNPAGIFDFYSNEEEYIKGLKDLTEIKGDILYKYMAFLRFFSRTENDADIIEIVKSLSKRIDVAKDEDLYELIEYLDGMTGEENYTLYENIAVYYFFRHFFAYVDRADMVKCITSTIQIINAIEFVLIGQAMSGKEVMLGDWIDILSRISKHIEHGKEGLDKVSLTNHNEEDLAYWLKMI